MVTFFLFTSFLVVFKFSIFTPLLAGLLFLSVYLLLWMVAIEEESMSGFHNFFVKGGLKFSFFAFVFSEVMLFFSLFWAFFDSALSNMSETGQIWPPYYINPIEPFSLPLLNTMLLLFSSVILTWLHVEFYQGKNISLKLISTIFMGFFFVYLQFVEYKNSGFSYSSGIFGCVFFTLTGLHGTHVILGGIFLLAFLFNYIMKKYTITQSLWLDLSSFYWHFVDVIWFFVWGFVYIWGY